MDQLEAMRSYVQVVDSGSFTKAAQVLARHKSTVSEQVAQLEAHLGVRLLVRSTRSVRPSAEGLTYHARARQILAQLDAADAELRAARLAPSGRLRVQVPVALGRLVLMPAMRGLLDRHPQLAVELGCSDQTVDLVREGLDCAIRGGELPDSSLVVSRLGDLPFVLCAAPRYVDAHGLPRHPDELARHLRVGYLPAGQRSPPPLRLVDGAHHVTIEVPARLLTTDSGAMLSAGLDGLGIIQVAEFVARHHLASGALLRVLPGWSCPPLPVHFVTPTARLRGARVRAFQDWVREVLSRQVWCAAPPLPGR